MELKLLNLKRHELQLYFHFVNFRLHCCYLRGRNTRMVRRVLQLLLHVAFRALIGSGLKSICL